MAEQITGTVRSVIGPVVDFAFSEGHLPEIYDAIKVKMDDESMLTFEVAQQLGNSVVRTVSMEASESVGQTLFSNSSPENTRWGWRMNSSNNENSLG